MDYVRFNEIKKKENENENDEVERVRKVRHELIKKIKERVDYKRNPYLYKIRIITIIGILNLIMSILFVIGIILILVYILPTMNNVNDAIKKVEFFVDDSTLIVSEMHNKFDKLYLFIEKMCEKYYSGCDLLKLN